MDENLLKYKCKDFDYTKINNKAYVKRKQNQLLLNYHWNETKDIIRTVNIARELSSTKWYDNIISIGLIDEVQTVFKTLDKNEILKQISNVKCLHCGNLISPNLTYCSITCANASKLKDPNYILKLSNSIKEYHKNISKDKKGDIYEKISSTLRSTNSTLTQKERTQKYSNKNIRYTSYNNLNDRFKDIIFLCNELTFKHKKFLMVKCRHCGFEWEVTKTTTISRTECKKCNPKKKHKTQTAIFDYIYDSVYAKENVRNVISNELDIYVPSINLAIEYDGLLGHSFGPSKVKYFNSDTVLNSKYHLNKTDECESLGIQLWHIFENEYIDKNKRNIWLSKIDNKLNKSKKIYARSCQLMEIHDTKDFFNRTHLQGNCNSSIKIGLFYDGVLVSCMSFRKHRQYEWEIARFSSELGVVIIGGAGKLLKYFERTYKPKSIISYANRRWSQGNLYEKLGFTFIENTPPNYWYFKENENVLYSREKFQKHKLKNILTNYDDTLTEVQNMFNNGYRIIFDSGNKKFIKFYN